MLGTLSGAVDVVNIVCWPISLPFGLYKLFISLRRKVTYTVVPAEDTFLHVRMLGLLGLFRAEWSLMLGAVLTAKGLTLTARHYGSTFVSSETLSFDKTCFVAIGLCALFLSTIRLLQGISILAGQRIACRWGLYLAVFDMVNLVCFPLSTSVGLYGWVVYRRHRLVLQATASGRPRSADEPQRHQKETS